tara:strand:- start:2228 stop:2926 length:699 start_codon:yes stop_codon:yes gene_type:complete
MTNSIVSLKALALLVFSSSYLLSLKSISNEQILNHLKEDQNWILIEQRKDSVNVFEMDIPQMNLNALRVEKIVEINPNKAIDVVMNIESYPEVMENNTMTSFIIGEKDGEIYAYNKFPIPIPFVSARHYFFKIKNISDFELNWTLVEVKEINLSSTLSRILNENNEAVYVEHGAGMWKIDNVSGNLSKVSYSLYMDSGGSLSDYLNDFIASQSIIMLFNGILKKAGDKSYVN